MKPEPLKSKILNFSYLDYLSKRKNLKGVKVNNYLIQKQLGSGSFGSVWEGVDKKKKQTVAIKVLDLQAVENQKSAYKKKVLKRLIKSEAEMMSRCHHQNVIKCYDVYQNRSLKFIIMEYCKDGNLEIQVKKNKGIPEQDAVIILKQILNGLSTLHSNKIIHRDLKPENILIHEGVYKIADFGFSKQLQSNDPQFQLPQTKLGTLYTMAPQVIKGKSYGLQADIWSIGVIFYFILYAKQPYRQNSYDQILKQISSSKNIFQVQHRKSDFKLSSQARQFITQCLQIDSKKRLNWKNITQHKLFKKYQNNLLKNTDRPDVKLNRQQMSNILNQQQKGDLQQNTLPQIPQNPYSQQQTPMNTPKNQNSENYELARAQTAQKSAFLQSTRPQWLKQTHLQCVKTSFILSQIIQPIQRCSKQLLKQRQIIQILYLMLTRCYINMKVKLHELNDFRDLKTPVELKKLMQENYNQSQKKQKQYNKKVTEKQNEILEIIKDKIYFLVNCQRQKQFYLTGSQSTGQKVSGFRTFTKRQQIEFTQKQINKAMQLFQKDSKIDLKLLAYLKNYQKIWNLSNQTITTQYHNFDHFVEDNFSAI